MLRALLAIAVCSAWACVVYALTIWPTPSPTAAGELLIVGLAGAALLGFACWRSTFVDGVVLAVAVAAAASLSAVIAWVQYLSPAGIPGWIEPLIEPGRAYANLRQPNHLALLLAWGLVACAWLQARPGVRVAAAVLMASGLVLTGSRMALGFALILGLWGLLDKKLPRPSRVVLWTVPCAAALTALALWWASEAGALRYYGGERLASMLEGQGSVSGRRAGLWLNTFEMIGRHPWLGVGWGQFNLHYALGSYERVALPTFTHAHNLPLQLAAELGVPAAALLMGALTAWVWWCRPVWTAQPGCYLAAGLVLVGMHSLLELPLWYAYFLLPTLAAMAALTAMRLRLYATDSAVGSQCIRHRLWRSGAFCVGLVMLGLAAALAWDYAKVVPPYSTAPTSKTLDERVARAQQAVFFRHAGLYARVITLPLDASLVAHLPLMQATARHYVDVGLMRRWAMALVFAGDVDAAEHLAWRLWRYDPDQVAELRAFAGAHASNPSWQRFAAYLVNPTPVNLPLDRLLPAL